MALTLADVVDNHARMRVADARRDSANARDAAETRRERFSLEEAGRGNDLATQRRSAATQADAVRAGAAKANTAKTQPAGTQDGPDRTDRGPAPRPDHAKGREASTGAAAVRPSASAKPGKLGAKPSDTRAEDAESIEHAVEEPKTSSASGDGAVSAAKVATEATSAASPSLIVPVAIPLMPKTPAPTAFGAEATEPDGEAEIEVSDGGTKSAAGEGQFGGGKATAYQGFEAELTAIEAGTPVEAAAAAGAETPKSGAPAAGTDAKTAAADSASHLQGPLAASPASAPVPLGAVPMTIGLRALGASNRFEIRLDPKELGRIDVSIDIDTDTGSVGARLVVDRPETLALLQRDAASLQQALSQTGLDASAGISLSLRGGEGEQAGREPGSEPQSHMAGHTDHAGLPSGTDTVPLDLVPLRALRGLGRVDIRI